MTRFSKYLRVFFIEEWIEEETAASFLEIRQPLPRLWIATPHIARGLSDDEALLLQQEWMEALMLQQVIRYFICWYYTPMALRISQQLQPSMTVYDCMDELAAFKMPPAGLKEAEAELFKLANLVFTGGESLYDAKCLQHPRVYAFPSGIDFQHFSTARIPRRDPDDQHDIPYPRLGFFGVLDERLDIPLLKGLAMAQPDWHFILIGPVAKIDPASLPVAPNIHYLGMRSYVNLPDYISNWNVALLLFARNESTRFISPTKTPEYLAAGKPVVSTPIKDVVTTYGDRGLVHIAEGVNEFAMAAGKALRQSSDPNWLQSVDTYLAKISWDSTWDKMAGLICGELRMVDTELTL
jgi:UDP-galactopyranose mutase